MDKLERVWRYPWMMYKEFYNERKVGGKHEKFRQIEKHGERC